MIQSLKDAVQRRGVGTIDIREAHIWWDFPKDQNCSGVFRIFEFRTQEDMAYGMTPRAVRDTGACVSRWNTMPVEHLLQELREMVVEFSCRGIPANDIVREMAKVRQFAALGATSFYMARALSTALTGNAYDNLEFWSRFSVEDGDEE